MVLLANRLALEGMNFLIGHANDRSVRRLNRLVVSSVVVLSTRIAHAGLQTVTSRIALSTTARVHVESGFVRVGFSAARFV